LREIWTPQITLIRLNNSGFRKPADPACAARQCSATTEIAQFKPGIEPEIATCILAADEF
jgi:hypothetical protein